MLVATFGPSTAWVGKKITHDNGQFMLEGHGAIALLNVVEYDRQGHLIWSNDTTRSWVGSLAKAQAARPTQVATVPNEVAFATARYLGGSTLFGPPTKGRLSVTAQHVGVGFNLYVRCLLYTSDAADE